MLEYTLIELPIEIFINSQLAYFNFQGLLVWHSFGFDIFVLLRFYLEKTLLKVNKKISYYLVQGDGMRVHALRLILIIFWRRIKKFFIVFLASFVFANMIYTDKFSPLENCIQTITRMMLHFF